MAATTRHQFSGSLFVSTDLKLGRSPIPLPLTLAVLPSMSLTPSAPFAICAPLVITNFAVRPNIAILFSSVQTILQILTAKFFPFHFPFAVPELLDR